MPQHVFLTSRVRTSELPPNHHGTFSGHLAIKRGTGPKTSNLDYFSSTPYVAIEISYPTLLDITAIPRGHSTGPDVTLILHWKFYNGLTVSTGKSRLEHVIP